MPTVQVDLAGLPEVAEQDIEIAITIEVSQCDAPGTAGCGGVDRGRRRGKVPLSIIQVNQVAEHDVEGTIAVEVAEHYALGMVAIGVQRGGRGRKARLAIVEIDLARPIIAEENINGAIAVDVAQRRAGGEVPGRVECDRGDCAEAAMPVVQVNLAWLPIVSKQNVKVSIAVEVA